MKDGVQGSSKSDGTALWSSRYIFLMAAIGSAVGLANLWKFPYTAGEYGGGAFVLVYGIAVLFISVPVFMAELMVGRKGRASPEESLARVSADAGAHPRWKYITLLGILSAFLTLSFYFVIAGWALYYAMQALSGTFQHADTELVRQIFDDLANDPAKMILYQTIFAGLVLLPLLLGFHDGIERGVKLLMPIFFILFGLTLAVSLFFGDIGAAVSYLFRFDFSALSGKVMVYAVGQAFFSVGVGACVLMVFGARLDEGESILRSALIVAGVDTAVALLAGFAIFPIVFAHGLNPSEGPSLLFISIPLVLGGLPGGELLTCLFFVMVAIAALTSAMAIALPPAEWFAQQMKCGMRLASAVSIGLEWVLGLATIFSFNFLADYHPLSLIPLFKNLNPFQIIEMMASNITLPVGGLLLSLFMGWVLPRSVLKNDMGLGSGAIISLLSFCYRYLIPLFLICVMGIGISESLGK